MKQTIFTGAATALITPFKNGAVDYESYEKILENQISAGINALVVAGTTGESSTLTDAEHREIIEFTVDRVNHRVPVIAGTGSNDTSYAIELSKFACKAGADALLLVTPYYNKATQNGLYESFKAVAEAADKPCILYNVPSRTGCSIAPATAKRLSEIDNITAIKEASGNISQVAELSMLCGDRLDIYSGNDDQIVPILSLGGKGVISVLSNILPAETSEICTRFFNGDTKGAREMQLKYLPLISALFSEVNPIPAKAAMSAMYGFENSLRLPLTPMEDKNRSVLLELMKNEGLI